jgi:hypothetical protein
VVRDAVEQTPAGPAPMPVGVRHEEGTACSRGSSRC